MRAALRLGDDQVAADQLERLVLVEGAQIDQPLVFHALPAAAREWRLLHAGSVASSLALVNRRRFATPPRFDTLPACSSSATGSCARRTRGSSRARAATLATSRCPACCTPRSCAAPTPTRAFLGSIPPARSRRPAWPAW